MRPLEKRAVSILIGSVIGLLILGFVSLFWGRFAISPKEVIEVLYFRSIGRSETSFAAQTVLNIRLPRMLLAVIVGAGLSVSGASFQGIFQNRLVSPDILGVSNGAGFGAALAMLIGCSPVGVTVVAFLGGILSVMLSYGMSMMKREHTVLALVLSGIVVASFFSALISFVKLIADTESTLPSITYWLMGSFAGADYKKVIFAFCMVGMGIVVLFLMRWRINLLSMGDEEAYTLGICPKKNRLIVIAACTLITSACVTVTGIIGWIGMIMPNICRDYVSANNRWLLPAASVVGGFFMLLVDILARTLTAAEIPVGILTAVFGAPLFVMIYFKKEG